MAFSGTYQPLAPTIVRGKYLIMEENSKTALLIIDMQRDFVEPRAVLCVAGAAATVPAIDALARRGRELGWAIIHIVRAHRADGSDAEPARRHLFADSSGYCVAGTRGAEIVDGISVCTSDITVVKTRFSGFFRTDLDSILSRLGTRRIVVAGTQYPNCIRATAVDALMRDYEVAVCTDCCSAADEQTARANVADMRRMGICCLPADDIK